MELFVFARFHARSGNESDVIEALHDVIVPTREEPGCLSIHAYRVDSYYEINVQLFPRAC